MIDDTGFIKTPTPLPDGEHKAFVYKRGADDIEEVMITVKDNR